MTGTDSRPLTFQTLTFPMLAITALCSLAAPATVAASTALPVAPPECEQTTDILQSGGLEQIQSLFTAGCFAEAVTQGQLLGARETLPAAERSDAYALAARASLSASMADPLHVDAASWVDRGERLAWEALVLDPENVEGHLQRAIALGLQARSVGSVEALRGGYADEARAHIDAALALAPNEPYAMAVDGAWHLEVVTGAGRFAASMMFGADADEGMARFEEARKAPGASLMIDVQYAVAALVFDQRRSVEAAREALTDALDKPSPLAIEQFHQDLAKALMERMDDGERSDDVARLAAQIQGRDV